MREKLTVLFRFLGFRCDGCDGSSVGLSGKVFIHLGKQESCNDYNNVFVYLN